LNPTGPANLAPSSADANRARVPAWARRLIIAGLILTILVSFAWTSDAPNLARAAIDGEVAATVPATSPAVRGDDTSPTSTQPWVPPGMTLIDGEVFAEVRGTPGFWRVGRTASNVHWFISPDNRVEWLNTVQTVQPFQLGRRGGGPHYASRDWTGVVGDLTSGDLNAWASRTLDRVRNAGFKGLGAWCNPVFHQFDVPITRDLNLSTYAIGHGIRFYDTEWAYIVEAAVARQVIPLKDNRNVVGFYTDNELDWGDTGSGPSRYFDGLSPSDPNRRKVVEVIRRLWPELADFNAAWKLNLATWDALDSLAVLPHEPPDAYGKLFTAWLEQLASDYFRITTTLVKKYAPNHLVMGVRYRGHAPREVVRGARGWTDAQSINYYVPDAQLDADMFPMMYEESGGQAIVLTEYSFHALDGRSGNRNTFGFAAQVMDQQARADGYRIMTSRLARTPYIVGGDWFQWSDEPPSGRTVDGEDVNFGVVDVDDRPYELLVQQVRELTPKLNEMHRQSRSDTGLDVFRQRFDERPRFVVPYLTSVPTLNGELSDWPSSSRLTGMKRSQAVGLDRSPLPVPDVFLGWNERGLFVGIQVHDNDVEGAPATGWWWTRDCVELFISTRVPDAKQNFYTPHDTQFFFTPIAFPGPDGSTGTVGRWKRQGDGIDATRAPDPSVTEASRVFPDRYVVEMFIPASQLQGFDPTGNTPMALNVYARNFQTATEYFWSAPKEVQMQLRPGTWGILELGKNDAAPVAKGN
jgi:hypothetical protein